MFKTWNLFFKRIHFNFHLTYMCVCMKHSYLVYWRHCVIAGIEIIIGARQFVTLDPLLIKCWMWCTSLHDIVTGVSLYNCNNHWWCVMQHSMTLFAKKAFWNSHQNLVRKRVIWCYIEYRVLLMLKNKKS